MNKKVIGIVVVVAVLLTGAYFIFAKKPSTPLGTANNEQSQTGTFRDLAKSSTPQKCSITNSAGGTTSTGVVYIADGMMRGDFTTSGGTAGSVDSHMIVKNGFSYVWNSASSVGFKISIPSSGSGGQANTSSSLSYDQPVSYNCKAWSADSSLFTLPTGISFNDVSQVQTGAAGSLGGGLKGTAEQCGACNSLSGAQKAQCLVALSCQ